MKVTNEKIESGIWSVDVDGVNVRVENKLSTVKLFVKDELQDIYLGMIGCPHLTGVLPDGRPVKAAIGGDFKMHCYIFVDNKAVIED